MKTLGQLLKNLRVERHLTQSELANILNYSRKQIVRIENDIQSPSIKLLHTLSKTYNVDLLKYMTLEKEGVDNYVQLLELRNVINEHKKYSIDKLHTIHNDYQCCSTSEEYKLLGILISLSEENPDLVKVLKECEALILEDSQVEDVLDFTQKYTLNIMTYHVATIYVVIYFELDKELGYEYSIKLESILSSILNSKCNNYITVNKDILACYLSLVLNISAMEISLEKYEEAINWSTKVYQQLITHEYSFLMDVVLYTYTIAHYKVGHLEKARNYHNKYKHFIEIFESVDLFEFENDDTIDIEALYE